MKRVLLGVLGLALLTGCGVRPLTPASGSTYTPFSLLAPSGPALPELVCSPEGVGFSVASTEAAMGLRVLTLEMVNCGTEPLVVNGYPTVRLFDADHEPITVTVGQGSAGVAMVEGFDAPPQEVVLRPWEKVRSSLLWRNLVTDATVNATTAEFLEVASATGEPWQEVPMVMPDPMGSGAMTVDIDLGNTDTLGVEAWRKA